MSRREENLDRICIGRSELKRERERKLEKAENLEKIYMERNEQKREKEERRDARNARRIWERMEIKILT